MTPDSPWIIPSRKKPQKCRHSSPRTNKTPEVIVIFLQNPILRGPTPLSPIRCNIQRTVSCSLARYSLEIAHKIALTNGLLGIFGSFGKSVTVNKLELSKMVVFLMEFG